MSMSTTSPADVQAHVAVIGTGAVGLATVRRATRKSSTPGLYYPADSLKTRLCLRGKKLSHRFCRDHGVNHAPCRKWVVGGDSEHAARTLGAIETHAARFGIPLERVDLVQTRKKQPKLSKCITRVLSSPSTGIVASHEYMDQLAQMASDSGAGHVATSAKAENVAFNAERDTYRPAVRNTDDDGDVCTLDADMVVNAAGSVHRVHRLLYPVPDANLTSLGVHTTVNLQGAAKFGPDVEFLPANARQDSQITEEADSDRMNALHARFHAAISQYLDGIEVQDLVYDYCGIRAKITTPGMPARDFYVDRADRSGLPR
ncbi:hypothetical protein AMAG_09873 [Allomyces macrogynus ATCC 38327]|uniref:L-2-hydroxyglutarate dehydrogenase, mitochondrial n=1 Tax=Allomyces macrogynus (strain ATCC 38327) TaxID=578462 RepID=A0A0L0STN6_ALLM3|nr:hypothetical protein AMAG_09873 [Allomyces macrogynus ATCC 38327]|eukprot:KNE65908.1 hypothetical protein AMAG_09873 [Allomyces macrogynus ATCC 38327]